jgi:hypothetical protein
LNTDTSLFPNSLQIIASGSTVLVIFGLGQSAATAVALTRTDAHLRDSDAVVAAMSLPRREVQVPRGL